MGDGLIRLDAGGKVTYASPNAQSAYRRLGLTSHLVGEELAALISRLAHDPLEGSEAAARVLAALRGEAPPRREIEARGATVLIRALPLLPAGVPIGALVLVRDVTEVRRRDRALLTKDATIREIHHRVKNNLQTVAALLRLQARRVEHRRRGRRWRSRSAGSPRSRWCTRRCRCPATRRSSSTRSWTGWRRPRPRWPRRRPRWRCGGRARFGMLPAEIATPLVMVLNELLLNAVEHGFADGGAGEVVIAAHGRGRQLHVTVADTGRGLPRGLRRPSRRAARAADRPHPGHRRAARHASG